MRLPLPATVALSVTGLLLLALFVPVQVPCGLNDRKCTLEPTREGLIKSGFKRASTMEYIADRIRGSANASDSEQPGTKNILDPAHDETLRRFVDLYHSEQTLRTLQKLATKDVSCAEAAQRVGAYIYETKGNESFASGLPLCNDGYYVGVLNKIFEQAGSNEASTASGALDVACGKTLSNAAFSDCVRAIGQIFGANSKLDQSLARCDKLQGTHEACYRGAFEAQKNLDCTVVDAHQSDCFTAKIVGSVTDCQSLTAKNRDNCFVSLGRKLATDYWLADDASANAKIAADPSVCAQVPTGKDFQSCVRGFIEDYYFSSAEKSAVDNYCAKIIDSTDRNICSDITDEQANRITVTR